MKITTTTVEVPYESAFDIYKRLTQGNKISLLMESRSLNLSYGRKSLIVPDPALKITHKNNILNLEPLNKAGEYIKDNLNITERSPDKILRQLLDLEADNPFAALYGAIGYDFAKTFYKVGPQENNFILFFPSSVYYLDDIKEKAEKITFYYDGISSNTYTDGYTHKETEESDVDLTEEEYKDRVKKTIKDIKNGRCMQCVLSRKTSLPIKEHPLVSYEKLRKANPSPYSFFYNLGENEILYGASPERHITIENNVLNIRPIAGTIKRDKDPMLDAKARIQLLTDEKELREHTMLVDLARHELHYLCKDVHITDLFTLETYPNLYHLVSGVEGRLKDDLDVVDCLKVTLPAGTLSGAPKKEAMKMIEEYEGSKRDFYGGTIGYLAFNGDCNTGITIRSVHVKDGMSHVRAGAGIVALSDEGSELQECTLKSEKMVKVIS